MCRYLTGLPGDSVVKDQPANEEDIGDSGVIPGPGRPPGGGNATHSSVLAWKIPWSEMSGCHSPWGRRESDMIQHHLVTQMLVMESLVEVWNCERRKDYLCVCCCMCVSKKRNLHRAFQRRLSPGIHNRKSLVKLQSARWVVWGVFAHESPPCVAQNSPLTVSSVNQSCLTLCDPMDCSTPGLPVHHQLLELTQAHVLRVSDAIQPVHPLSSPSSSACSLSQHQGIFKWVTSSHQVTKVLEFQLQYQSFQRILRTDFL